MRSSFPTHSSYSISLSIDKSYILLLGVPRTLCIKLLKCIANLKMVSCLNNLVEYSNPQHIECSSSKISKEISNLENPGSKKYRESTKSPLVVLGNPIF